MVTIYSIPSCPYCNELKDILTERNIKFNDVDVNLPENEKEFDKIYAVTKSDDVPTVRVYNQLLVPERSFKTIEECADLIVRFLTENV
jgi:glutaredoxin